MPRLVVPGYPHHVTQRGNRRMQTFFCADDYRAYLELLAEGKRKAGVSVWAYCLMPYHVHIVAVPEENDGLARLFRFVHRHYSRRINFRENWRGHLWQERFHSFVMDERYLRATVRYTELNPVRARLCRRVEDWPWSSARAHLSGRDDAVVSVKPMLDRIGNWHSYLSAAANDKELERIRRCSTTGRPGGDASFVNMLEDLTGRELTRRKPGPKPAIK
jgi:putative transposase